jgi:hypothetical protein
VDTSTFQSARLIPITGIKGDQEQERRATSALLAVIQAVPEFARAILKPLGAPAGKVTSFIEPEFIQEDKKVRPDGLIVVSRGAKSWSVAVEVKTNKNDLVAEQINSYLDVCRDNGIDALLTISNQVLTLAGAHPAEGIDGRKTRKIQLQHYSWMRVLSEAQFQKEHRGISDPDQAWILGELIRYLESPSSGALEFTDMGESWVATREAISNGTLSPQDKGAQSVIQRYESLLRYTSFKLSARLGVDVAPVASKPAREDPAKNLKSAVSTLAQEGKMSGSIRVADTIAPLDITVDVRAGQVLCAVSVDAPREGRPLTRVNWLLRQLKNSPSNVRVETFVKRGRQAANACLLSEAHGRPETLVPADGKEISQFVVTHISSMGTKRGEGKNSFVTEFLASVDTAYQAFLENLHAWTPKAPRLPDTQSFHETDASSRLTGDSPTKDEEANVIEVSQTSRDG